MFDPTVFDNIKVFLENHLYDMDNLDGKIRITGRIDRLEMSVMSREFALFFQLAGSNRVTDQSLRHSFYTEIVEEALETGEDSCFLLAHLR